MGHTHPWSELGQGWCSPGEGRGGFPDRWMSFIFLNWIIFKLILIDMNNKIYYFGV